MKRTLVILLVMYLLLFTLTPVPAFAAQEEEEWPFAGARGGLIRATYLINTTTLKTSTFNFYNETDNIYAIPHIEYEGVEVWRAVIAPNTTVSYPYVVNFQRLPKNDPDDPSSIRYPKGYSFGMWTGDDPNAYPPPP